jgi:signal transduction histidine kinase
MNSTPPVPVRLEPESLDVTIAADLNFLPRVFKNLIENGCEHVVASENDEVIAAGVHVVCSLSQDAVVIDVINGGTPVPDYLITTFFDKFNSTKSGSGGTGLGTTYARIVTEAHGGDISVSSSVEEGTRVRVTLPRVVS